MLLLRLRRLLNVFLIVKTHRTEALEEQQADDDDVEMRVGEEEFDDQSLSRPLPASERGQNLHSNRLERLPSCLLVLVWGHWRVFVRGLPWS